MTNTKGIHREAQEQVAVNFALSHCHPDRGTPNYQQEMNEFLTHYEAYMVAIDEWYQAHQ